MKFKYQGLTRQREKVIGTIEAQDEVEARLRLRAMQIRADSLVSSTNREYKLPAVFRQSAINLKGMIIFTRQFSSLIDSGVAIVQCLDILAMQEKRPPFKRILIKVKEDIEGGSGLADALSKHQDTFPSYFIRIIEAGELSGTLDRSLKRLGIQMEKLGRLRAKVFNALLYPVITVAVAIVVVIFLLTKVIPEIAKLYGNSPLPDITMDVIKLSHFISDYFPWLIGGSLGSIVGFTLLYRLEGFRKKFDEFWLKVPLFGSLAVKSSVARFARTLSTLIACGVPLLNGFDICEKVIDNRAIRRCIRAGAVAVSEGKGIAVGLAAGQVFPPMVIHMVSIGEMTGRLDELMAKVADIYDDEVDDAVANLTGVLQPMLIVVVGCIIAVLMLAMYMPIFNLSEHAAG